MELYAADRRRAYCRIIYGGPGGRRRTRRQASRACVAGELRHWACGAVGREHGGGRRRRMRCRTAQAAAASLAGDMRRRWANAPCVRCMRPRCAAPLAVGGGTGRGWLRRAAPVAAGHGVLHRWLGAGPPWREGGQSAQVGHALRCPRRARMRRGLGGLAGRVGPPAFARSHAHAHECQPAHALTTFARRTDKKHPPARPRL